LPEEESTTTVVPGNIVRIHEPHILETYVRIRRVSIVQVKDSRVGKLLNIAVITTLTNYAYILVSVAERDPA
jgi:hypothetical protein